MTKKFVNNELKTKYSKENYKPGVKTFNEGFPGGLVAKNPPANAGDTGSIPDPRQSHMLWSN